MQESKRFYFSFFKILLVLFSCLIISSLSIHTIQIDHVHHGAVHHEAGDGANALSFDEYLHGSEKKSFFLLLLTLLVVGAGFASIFFEKRASLLVDRVRTYLTYLFSPYVFDLYRELLRNGFLNTKVH